MLIMLPLTFVFQSELLLLTRKRMVHWVTRANFDNPADSGVVVEMQSTSQTTSLKEEVTIEFVHQRIHSDRKTNEIVHSKRNMKRKRGK